MSIRNIFFIDSRVIDYQTLVNSLPTDSKWFLLNAEQDGIEQIQVILKDYTDLESIQIVSHGSQGTLFLGNVVLSNNNISNYVNQLSNIGSNLTKSGDILLYGCNVAEGSSGLQFVNTLSKLTGANVAASVDNTGASNLGGNWNLEMTTGVIESQGLLNDAYSSLLIANTAPTFMIGDGKVSTFSGYQDVGRSITVQGDGRILLGGFSYNGTNYDFSMVRYNSDGSLDTAFGDDGKVITDFRGFNDQGQSVTVQDDGKILVAGQSSINGTNYDFSLVRYSTDGSLDTSFDNDGKVTTDFSGYHDAIGQSVALQDDGKILVAGYGIHTSLSGYDITLARYNSDGTLDTSFDSDGKVITDIGDNHITGQSIAVQTDDKILVAGFSSNNGTNYGFSLVRYNSDGTLDTTFDNDGKVTTDFSGYHDAIGQSVTLQADGKILVAGNSLNGNDSDFALARYNSDGSLDITFNGNGKVTTNIISSDSESGFSATVQADGKILVAGTSYYAPGLSIFTLVRYNPDGTLDTAFGDDGKVTTDFSGINHDNFGYSVTVQPDDKILVGGSNNNNFALVRYNSDGSLDTTFGSNRTNTLDATSAYTKGNSPVVLDNNVQVFDSELAAAGSYSGATLTLSRHGSANSSDLFFSYGTLGTLTQGASLTVGGTTIGTVTTNSVGTLKLTFNPSATQNLVNQAMSQIAYKNISVIPPSDTQNIVIDWVFNDGNTGSQGTGGALIATGSTTVIYSNSVSSVSEMSIVAANANKDEGNNGSTSFTFTVSRSNNSGDATISYAATGAADATRSAANASDFVGGVLPSGTISFSDGETSKTLTISVAGDFSVEAAEQFNVILTNPINATLGTSSSDFGVINNDDRTAAEIFRTEGQIGGDGTDTGILETGMIRVMADFSKAAYSLQAYSLQSWETASIGGQKINDLSPLADTAYDAIISQKWAPLLDLNPALDPSTTVARQTVTNRMSDGYYTNGNAAAFVARSSDAVVISFRGTNDNADQYTPNENTLYDKTNEIHPDKDQWTDMDQHYALFKPLIDALDKYVDDATHEISKVYVTGHSMGGAMAIQYLSTHLDAQFGTKYEAVSFAAPVFATLLPGDKIPTKSNYPDARMPESLIQIEVARDPVPMTYEAGPFDAVRPGHVIRFEGNQTMDEPDNIDLPYWPNYDANSDNHSMDYYRQITKSIDPTGWSRILTESGDQSVFIGAMSGPSFYSEPIRHSPTEQGDQFDTSFIVDGQSSLTGHVLSQFTKDVLEDPLGADYDIYYGGRGTDRLVGGSDKELMLGGHDGDFIYGFGDDDRLYGDAGDDWLIGGEGIDWLEGGAGSDSFRFDSNKEGSDFITDFQSGIDKIMINSKEFGKLPLGALDANHFVANSDPHASSKETTFLYDTDSGKLVFDKNGIKNGGDTLIATLIGHEKLLESDILII